MFVAARNRGAFLSMCLTGVVRYKVCEEGRVRAVTMQRKIAYTFCMMLDLPSISTTCCGWRQRTKDDGLH